MVKVGVFVDVENVVTTFGTLNIEVRFDVLLNYLRETLEKEGKVLWKAVAFVPIKKGDKRREGLISALSFQGWRVITKLARRQPSGALKANMDMEIAIELLQTSDSIDEVVLITGDGDFVPLVDLLSKKGKRIWVIGTRKGSVAVELIRVSDKYQNITDIDDIRDENGERLYPVLRKHMMNYATGYGEGLRKEGEREQNFYSYGDDYGEEKNSEGEE